MNGGKILFYFVAFLFITNALGYLSMRQFKSFLALLLIPVVASTFIKNRTGILVLAMVVTILLTRFFPRLTEGMENVSDETKEKVKESKETKELTPEQKDKVAEKKEKEPVGVDSVELSAMSKTGKSGKNNRIDYASTIESAYSQLQDNLGKDGLKKLTGDTHDLINKQKELFETMQGMTPMLSQAMEMLNGLDLKSLKGITANAQAVTSQTQ
jgi:hypothetical protein